MPGRKLKNHKVYLDRLVLFAQAMNIRLEYGDELDSDGIWMPAVRKIKIDSDIPESDQIAAILHELGHSMDDMFKTPVIEENKVFKAYFMYYGNKKISKKQRKLILACEEKAWSNGRDIAYRLKIRLGKWYDEFERACLESYRKDTSENT